MFKRNKSYLLISILLLGLSGCSEKKVLIIKEPIRHTQRVIHYSTTDSSGIKEEILIKKNPNLGNHIDIDEVEVPQNNPTLAIKSTTTQEPSSELNGKIIERMPFPEDEYRQLKKFGRNTVHGIVYLQNSISDEKVLGKNIELFLNPVTSYSKQWYNQSYLGGYKLTSPDKRLFNYLKSTKSDENGEFDFFGVPKGDYYLIGKITCSEECGFQSNKIIRLVKEINVDGTTDVELTKVVP